MKANEAPEKIYLHPDIGDKEFIKPWLRKPFNQNSIEYTRTDAFIEKIVKWIESTFSMDYNESEMNAIVKEFKEYMKGE